MLVIAKLTFQRVKDPAMAILFLMGAVLAFFFNDSDVFEIFRNTSKVVDTTPRTGIFLGTIILAGLGVMITIFNATSEIPRDINSRLISVLLSKPLSRFEYVMGKFLGTLFIAFSFTFLWVTVMLVARATLFDNASLDVSTVVSQYLCLLALAPTCAFATTVSCFFSDMVSMIITSSYVFISFSMMIAPIIAALSGAIFGKLVLLIYFLFPNYMLFFQNKGTLVGCLGLILYAASLSAIFVVIGVTRFNEGDIFSRD